MNTIESVIKEYTGKTPIPQSEYIDLWLQWYKGNVAKFHTYKAYNGKKEVKCNRRTLNIPKKSCEDWANLLLNEKTDVVYGDEQDQEQLWKLLNKVGFWVKGNEGIEKSFALGTGAFVESFDDEGNERLQFINAKKIYPITIDQDKITECAFVNVNSDTTVLQIHIKDETNNYIIITLKFLKKDRNTSSDDIGDLFEESVVESHSKNAWFQIVKPNIANNIDINSPLGISIFANSLDTLAGIDLAYDGFCDEMRLGKCRVFVNSRLIDYVDGKPIFDCDDIGFYFIGEGEDGKNKPLEFYNPSLRTDQYFSGITNSLNVYSSKVGFGENHYRFDNGGISTATQVVSENSEMFRTIKKHEILLNDVIIDVCRALMYIHNEYSRDSYKFDLDKEIEVKFDDSIIEDKESQKASDRIDVNMGAMSKVQYRMKWFNEDEATARANIEAINEELRANTTNFFSEE